MRILRLLHYAVFNEWSTWDHKTPATECQGYFCCSCIAAAVGSHIHIARDKWKLLVFFQVNIISGLARSFFNYGQVETQDRLSTVRKKAGSHPHPPASKMMSQRDSLPRERLGFAFETYLFVVSTLWLDLVSSTKKCKGCRRFPISAKHFYINFTRRRCLSALTKGFVCMITTALGARKILQGWPWASIHILWVPLSRPHEKRFCFSQLDSSKLTGCIFRSTFECCYLHVQRQNSPTMIMNCTVLVIRGSANWDRAGVVATRATKDNVRYSWNKMEEGVLVWASSPGIAEIICQPIRSTISSA